MAITVTNKTDNSSTYNFRSELMANNFEIERIFRKTGIYLSKFVIQDEGFYASKYFRRLFEVGTDWSPYQAIDTPGYQFYEYDERANEMREELMDGARVAYHRRKTIIGGFKEAWKRSPCHDNGRVKVHFGLYEAKLTVPWRVIGKYSLLLREQSYAYELCTGQDGINGVFGWSPQSLVAFGDFLDLIDWKIEEHQRTKVDRHELFDFQDQRHCCKLWEHKVFNLPI